MGLVYAYFYTLNIFNFGCERCISLSSLIKFVSFLIVLFNSVAMTYASDLEGRDDGAQAAFSERGNYFIESFDLSQVGGDPRNYAVAKDDKGRVYVANNSGIFVFDGNQWHLLKQLHGMAVRSMAVSNDRLYIGGRGTFGFVQLNSISGNSIGSYQPLIQYLPEDKREVGVIKNTIVRPEGVYFRASHGIYFYRTDGGVMFISPDGATFHRMFVVHDKLIIQKRRVGLYELKNGQINDFVQGQFFADKTVYALLEYQQSFMILTADKGIYIYDGDTIEPYSVEPIVADLLSQNNIYLGDWLSNGLLALAVTGPEQGLILLNKHGHLHRLIGSSDGLTDTLINDMIEDSQGGLWLGLVNGLNRVELGSSLSYFDSRHGLEGYMFNMARYQSNLYVATSMGVFELVEGDHRQAYFTQVAGIAEACYALQPTTKGLIVACDANLYRIEHGRSTHIRQSIHNIYSLLDASINPEKPQMLVGHNNKLGLLSYIDERWQYQHLLDITSVTMAREGEDVVWLRHQEQGVMRLEFSQGFDKPPKQQEFDISHGLPKRRIYPVSVGNEVIFNSHDGLFRFEPAKDLAASRFMPEQKYGDLTDLDIYFDESPTGIKYLIEQLPSQSGIRNRSNARLAVIEPAEQQGMGDNGVFRLNFADFTRISTYPLLGVYFQSEQLVWVMSDDKLLRFSPSQQVNSVPQPFVSEVTLLHGGDQQLLSKDKPLMMNYEDNSIRFDFAFTAFDDYQSNQYQYKLAGFDRQWSDWSSNKHKEYTQIGEGHYQFELRARDVYGRVGDAQAVSLVIQPPWYRTWWAYVVYSLIFFSIVYTGTRFRTKALLERAEKLERIIEQRTKTIVEGSTVIEEQKEAIENLLAQKNDLFANISHEFRTPLTLILGPTQSLLKSDVNEQQKNQLQLVRQSSYRLLRMVNQILTLAKLSAIPHQERVSLSIKEHLDFMISSFMPAAKEKQINLKVEQVHDAQVSMVSDALEKILINLISNALKYTDDGGEVTIKVEQFKADWVAIAVTDTGYGIPKEQFPRVFERFKRINHPEHIKVQGTGLGLSMVKELVEAHGGKIYFETELGKGSTFVVELPQVDKVDDKMGNGGLIRTKGSVDIELQAIQINHAQDDVTPTDVIDEQSLNQDNSDSRLKLLIIEDTKQMCEFIASLFAEQYIVVSAADGEQGIELAKQHLPDIIISDVMMPGKSGFEVCKELKNDELTSHIPIILLTAKNDIQSRMQGWRERADEYLAKPFDEDELKLRVNNLLAIRKTLKLRFGRVLHEQPSQIEQVATELTGKDQDFLKRFADVIEQNYASSEFNLPMAASSMYVSERLLQKKLKALMDHTFTEYLRTYRLNKAAELLKQGSKASDAADECGFSSQAYFSRCFKAEFGKTATQYQQKD